MGHVKRIPLRDKIRESDRWDLSSLFASDEAWERLLRKWEKRIPEYGKFQGTLAGGAERLAECLEFDADFDRTGERLGTYAFLKSAEDTTNSKYQRMHGRFVNAASRAAQAASFVHPEILKIPEAKTRALLVARRLAAHRLRLERLLRFRPHTLGAEEEKLLAMQTEMAQAAGQIFRQLNDADLKFGVVQNEKGRQVSLSHAMFGTLMHSPKRGVRRDALPNDDRLFCHRKVVPTEADLPGRTSFHRDERLAIRGPLGVVDDHVFTLPQQ